MSAAILEPRRQILDTPCSEDRDLREICARLREAVCLGEDARRDRLLVEYRRAVVAQVRTDLATNLAQLAALAEDKPGGWCGDALVRMRGLEESISQTDPYRDGRTEERWWIELHQFYLDGLTLADWLLCRRRRGRRRTARPDVEFLGLKYPGKLRALVTALELNAPDIFRINPFNTYLPTLLHIAAHHVFPSKRLRFPELLGSGLGWVYRGGFEQLRGCGGPVVRFHGVERLADCGFDRRTGKTAHNVIVAVHHRLGYLDLPLAYAPWRPPRLVIWANNAFYGPGMEGKIARDRDTIPVRGRERLPLEQVAARTAELLTEARIPMLTFVDGSQPPLFYGQQLRVKSGLRLAVNATLRAAAGTGRRTFVLPLTLNDPVGLVQGVRDTIEVRFHAPLLLESPWTAEPEALVNGGDPLLNQLEAIYIGETSHAVRGLPRPRVVEATRERLVKRCGEPLLKRLLPPTIADLARHAAGWRVE